MTSLDTPRAAETADDALKRALASADEALFALGEGFRDEARRQVEIIERAIRAYGSEESADDPDRGEHAEALFAASHELRGQAGTFGYGLLGELCDSLCTLLELEKLLTSGDCSQANGEGSVWSAIAGHARAVATIVEKDLKGDGGNWGRQLSEEVARLRAFVKHAAT